MKRLSPTLFTLFLFTMAGGCTQAGVNIDPEGDDDDDVTTDVTTDDTTDDTTNDPDCDASVDADNDGLDECEELELGTDDNNPDSDADGFSDSEEVDCLTDPTDATEVCYACGWQHADPGGLGPLGDEEGDTLANMNMIDQCGESVSMHDFAGAYHILFMTTEWCGACLSEASELRQRTIDFVDESGLEFSYIIGIFQDVQGGVPGGHVALEYAQAADAGRAIPVLSDVNEELLRATPFNGSPLPGKCLLSTDMVLVDCYTGHGDDDAAFDWIDDDAAP